MQILDQVLSDCKSERAGFDGIDKPDLSFNWFDTSHKSPLPWIIRDYPSFKNFAHYKFGVALVTAIHNRTLKYSEDQPLRLALSKTKNIQKARMLITKTKHVNFGGYLGKPNKDIQNLLAPTKDAPSAYLYAMIGGVQAVEVQVWNIRESTQKLPNDSYEISATFIIHDTFGASDADLTEFGSIIGLYDLYVLQRLISKKKEYENMYRPFAWNVSLPYTYKVNKLLRPENDLPTEDNED